MIGLGSWVLGWRGAVAAYSIACGLFACACLIAAIWDRRNNRRAEKALADAWAEQRRFDAEFKAIVRAEHWRRHPSNRKPQP